MLLVESELEEEGHAAPRAPPAHVGFVQAPLLAADLLPATSHLPLITHHSSLTTYHLPLTLTTQTAFLEACQGGHASVAQVFLGRGIDTELRTNNQCVDRVETSPADTSLRGPPSPARPACCILRSACCGIVSSVSLTHILCTPRWTPLILAALCGSVELLELLLDRGAEINAADGSKWSTAQPREPSTLDHPSLCA